MGRTEGVCTGCGYYKTDLHPVRMMNGEERWFCGWCVTNEEE